MGTLWSPVEHLEARRMLAGDARPVWKVSFDDAAGTYSAYYADVTRVLQASGAEWGRLFSSPAAIDVSVRFDPTIATSSGRSTTVAFLYHDDVSGFDVYEQGAAAEINTGIDPNGAAADVEITIGVKPGANYLADKLWLDPNPAARTATIPVGRVDAMSVFMHELGHALGYNGWSNPLTGVLPGTYASTYDEYVYSSDGRFYFGGVVASEVYGTDPPLTPGNVFHLGSATGPGSDLTGQLMNGVTLSAGVRYEISPLDVAIMTDVGMDIERNAPAVIAKQFNFNVGQSLTVQFDESVRASLSASDFTIVRTGPGPVSTMPASAYRLTYDRATDSATLTFIGLPGGVLADGDYQLTIDHIGVTDVAGNAMAADTTLRFFALGGDANRDRAVDFLDLAKLAQNYNTSGGGKTYGDGDFNYDGNVDFLDLAILAQRYNTSLPAPGATLPMAATAASFAADWAVATAASVTAPIVAGPKKIKPKPVFSATPVVRPAPVKPKAPLQRRK
jgi:hypothetical protein